MAYRVLIADDEEIIRQGIEFLVDWERLDCSIVERCANGQEVIRFLEQSPSGVDIIISDIRMAGADGLDIFRRLLNAAPYMLRAGGLFACELYEGALDAAAELCRQAGLSDVRIVHDLTDRPRIVRAIVTEPKQRI